jgi:hypothetical protein
MTSLSSIPDGLKGGSVTPDAVPSLAFSGVIDTAERFRRHDEGDCR